MNPLYVIAYDNLM
jgi:hypothetical protein